METRSLLTSINPSKAALAASAILLWLSSVGVPPLHAGAVTALITVRAVVLPFASVKTVLEPASLTITEEDIGKGYVDEQSPSMLEIKSNSQRGSVLTLQAGEGPFTSAEVTFQGRTVTVGRQGGMLVFQASGRQIVSMRYRFMLAHDARPGVYPWPFSLSVSPL